MHPYLVVLDLHSYNHRRNDPNGPLADATNNPDINVGTGSMHRQRWSDILVGFMDALATPVGSSKPLDVRENVKFTGGHMVRWLHERFPDYVCAIAVEAKKTFMDEWTGTIDPVEAQKVFQALQSAANRVRVTLAGR
jgi:hypothetical protein